MKEKSMKKNDNLINKKMKKHIILGAIYQSIVLILLIFTGYEFSSEINDALQHQNSNGNKIEESNIFNEISSSMLIQNIYGNNKNFTVVFTVFSMLQLFNILNVTKINDELNLISGILSNSLLLPIWIGIFALQVIITQYAPFILQLDKNGLSLYQWIICVALGSSVLLVNLIIKMIPEECCSNDREKSAKIDKIKDD